MKAICKNNSHTWRYSLTLNKEYEVLREFTIRDTEMLEVKCDDGEVREYVAERFILVNE